MKTVSSLIFLIVLLHPLFSQETYKTKLLYSCDFEEQNDLNDWIMEGPGIAEIENGKLLLYSEYFDAVKEFYDSHGGFYNSVSREFYKAIEKPCEKE